MRRWRGRLTMRICMLGATVLMGSANRLRRAGLLRHRDAGRALAGASWLARRAMRAWRQKG